MSDWQSTHNSPEDVVVMTKIDDLNGVRNVQSLKRRGNLWWHPDGGMYVYYVPSHWRHLTDEEKAKEKT